MIFRVKPGKGMDSDKVHVDPVVARKLNGYVVRHNGEEVFICSDDIEILFMKKEERELPIRP